MSYRAAEEVLYHRTKMHRRSKLIRSYCQRLKAYYRQLPLSSLQPPWATPCCRT